MANLQLIGAVGVRVRPDARNFRNEAKRDIMAQLKDIEGDLNVTPNVKFDEDKLRREVKGNLKSMDLPLEVYLRPKLNDREFFAKVRKEIRDKVPNETSVRITADSTKAEKAISELSQEIEDLTEQQKKLPKTLDEIEDNYAKTFESVSESIADASKAIDKHEKNIDGLNSTMEKQKSIQLTLTKAQKQATKEIANMRAEAAAADERAAAARTRYHEVSGRALKLEQTEIRKANEERSKLLRAQIKEREVSLSKIEAEVDAEKKLSKELRSQLTDLNKKLKAQQGILKTQTEYEKQRREAYVKEKSEIEDLMDASAKRAKEAQAQLDREIELQNARSKSNKDLERSLNKAVGPWKDLRRQVEAGTSAMGSYMATLRRETEKADGQLLADLQEYQKRIQEFGKTRQAQITAEREFRKEMRINATPGFTDENYNVANWDAELNEAKRFADEAAAYINSKRATIEATPYLDPAALVTMERSLAYVTRPRDVYVKARFVKSRLSLSEEFDEKVTFPLDLRIGDTRKLARDIAEAFSGVGVAKAIGREMKSALRSFDDLAIGAAITAAQVGLITAAAGSATGSVTSLTTDLGELTALLLGTPAVLTMLTSMIYTTALGFDEFGAAVDGDAKALRTFGKDGQEAARSLGRLKRELNRTIKPSLWEGIGDSLTEMADAIREPLVEGLNDAAVQTGKAWAGIFRSMEKFAKSGQMEEAFRDMNEGIGEMSNATEPLFDAINRIGLVGSRYLPRLGRWATEGAESFRDWAIAADEAGDMERWIERAITHTKNLGSITKDTTGIISALGRASDSAGFSGLAGLAVIMDQINAAAQGDFFQINMGNIFEGSLEGMRAFGRGLKEIGRATLEQSSFIKDALTTMGDISEIVLTDIAGTFNNPRLLGGAKEFLGDLKTAAEDFGPAWDKMANGLGDGMRLFGEMVKGAAKIADAFLTVWDNSENLTAALERLIPWITDLVAAMVEFTHIPITAAMDGLAELINGFMDMPDILKHAALALGGLALWGPRINALGGYFRGMGRDIRNSTGTLGKFVNAWQNGMTAASNGGRVFLENSKMLSRNERNVARLAMAWNDASRAMGDSRSAISNVNGGMRNYLSTLSPFRKTLADIRERQRELTRSFVDGKIGVNEYSRGYQALTREMNDLTRSWSTMGGSLINNAKATANAWANAARDTVRGWGNAGRDMVNNWARASRDMVQTMGREVTGHMAQQGRRAGAAMTDGIAHAVRQFDAWDALDPSRIIKPGFDQAISDLRSQFNSLSTYARAAATDAARQTRDAFRNAFATGPTDSGFLNLDRMMGDPTAEGRRHGRLFGRAVAQGVNDGVAESGNAVQSSAGRLGQAFDSARDSIARSASNMGQSFQRVSSAASRMSSSVRTAFSNLVNSGVATATSQIQGLQRTVDSIRTSAAVTSLNNLARASATTAAAIGGVGGAGLRMAAGGLLDALGGPWGLALAAAGVALVHFGQKAADQRAKIEELKSSLDEFGNVTATTMETVANDLNTARTSFMDFDLRRIFKDGPENAGEALRTLGMTSKEVADMMVNDKDAYMDLANAMKDLGKGIRPSEEALQRLSNMTGISVDKLRELAPGISDAGEAMINMSGNVDAARDSFTNLNGEVTPASAKTKELADALRVIADEAAPAAEKVNALNDAIAQMNGEEITADKAVANMHEAIRSTAEALPGFVSEYQNFTDAIDDGTGKIDLNTPAGYALGEMLEGLGNKAKEAGFATGDMAGELQTARDGFIQTAKDAGLPDEAIRQLGAAWDSYVGSPEQAEKAIVLSGAAEAMEQTDSLLSTLGLEYDQERFEAWLDADPENAKLAVEDAEAAARAFADDEYFGNVGIEKGDFDVAMGEVESRGQEWDASKFAAWLAADPENAKLAADDAQAAARKFADDEYGARMTADDSDVKTKLAELQTGLQGVTGNAELWTAKFFANDEQFNAVMDSAKARGAEITNPDAFKAFISANADQFIEKKMTVDQILETWTGLPHDIRVNGVTEDAQWKLEEIDGKLQLINATPATATVNASGADAALQAVGQVKGELQGVNGTYTATVTAVDAATATIAVPKGQAEQFQKDYQGTLTGIDGASAIIQIPKGMAEQFNRDYQGRMTAVDGASATITVPKSMAEHYVKSYNGKILASDGASATIAIPQKNADAFVKDYNGNLTGTDSASGTIAVPQGAANDYEGSYNANITATDGASGILSGIVGWLDNIRRGAVAMVTGGGGSRMADGGILFGGAQKFADGGLTQTMRVIRKYADGGISDREMKLLNAAYNNPVRENHRAQIAKPTTPFRIWAEPETGGEAYIPLSSSKRARSTRIWEETGNRLNVNWEAYANGGVKGGRSTSSVAAAGRRERVQEIHVTNYYPQAEPTSVTVNRSLQFAANL